MYMLRTPKSERALLDIYKDYVTERVAAIPKQDLFPACVITDILKLQQLEAIDGSSQLDSVVIASLPGLINSLDPNTQALVLEASVAGLIYRGIEPFQALNELHGAFCRFLDLEDMFPGSK